MSEVIVAHDDQVEIGARQARVGQGLLGGHQRQIGGGHLRRRDPAFPDARSACGSIRPMYRPSFPGRRW